MSNKLIIYTDGGARGNPGPAGIGVVIYAASKNPSLGDGEGKGRGRIIKKYKGYLGEKTNNEAEYMAVIEALKKAKDLEAEELEINVDSELVARQLKNIYKVKQAHLQELVIKVRNLEQSFKKVSYYSIPREKNKLADQLVNEAIDEAQK